MLRILYYATWFFCLCFSFLSIGVCNPKPRLKVRFHTRTIDSQSAMNALVFLIVFVLITANRSGVDIIVYNRQYNEERAITFREPIYSILKNAFYYFGASFYIFRAALTFVAGALVYTVFRKLELNVMAFFSCYMPMLLFMDSMQFRNAIALCVGIYANFILINKNIKCRRLIYAMLIIVIAQVHTVFYFYLILLFFDTKYEKLVLFSVTCISGVISVMTLLNGNRIPFIDVFLRFILPTGDIRATVYLTTGNLGFLIPTFIHLLSIPLIAYIYVTSDASQNHKRCLLRLAFYLDICSLLFIPMMMMNLNFYRMLRNAFVIFIIASVFAISNENRRKSRIGVFALILTLSFVWKSFEMFFIREDVFECVLEGQLFWVN